MKIDKVLYCFNSNEYLLFEIKIYIENELDKSKLYHWLLFNKSSQFFKKLDFISMSDGERIFSQGKLLFNNKTAKLIMNNEELDFNVDSNNLDDKILELLTLNFSL